MRHRGLAVVAVAALAPAAALIWPVDARADRHGVECFGGYSFASSSLKGPAISCAIYLDFFVEGNDLPDTQPLPSPSPLATPPPVQGGPMPQPMGPAPAPAPNPDAPPRPARRWFAVGDVSRLSGDDDAGMELTRHLITVGLQRYLFVRAPGDSARPKRFHPFLRAMGGLTVDGGRGPAEFGPALAAGAGMDLRLWESKKGHGWGNLFLRGQCDAAYLFDPGDTTWRCSVGPSFRRED